MTAFFAGPWPRLFAHRGGSGEAPENTTTSFRRAVEIGVPYAELDVHSTRDGQIVVIHDETLERTTNGMGKVSERTLADLHRFDAGYWFSPDGGRTFPFRATGVTVPTLAEVLRSCPELRFTIEIKQINPPIEQLVVAAVRECGRAEEVILASEHDSAVHAVRTLAPEIATSLATGEARELFQRFWTGGLKGYRPPGQALQVPVSFDGIPLITPETVAAAHAIGLEVHVWTIDEPREMARLLALGVDGIMSDFPALLPAAGSRQ